jgi:hypothetical protein
MKIYYNGKRIRDNAGKFSSFKIKARIFLRKVLRVSLIGLAIYVAFIAGRYIQPSESIINVIQAESRDTLASKIEELKNEVVETIRQCESQGKKDLIYTFDPDPRQPNKSQASFGQFQYKLKTIVDYTKILKGETITERQALDIALDENKARELTKDIIFKDTGKAYNNWYNCSKKHNIATKVGIIKSLTQ